MNYYKAYICLNGHTSSCYSKQFENFCTLCGQKIINECSNCHEIIRGKAIESNVIDLTTYIPPDYCYNCGEPYPWTKSKLDSVKELISFDDQLTDHDKLYINENLDSLIIDSPKTTVTATKINIFLKKASATTVSAFRDILIDVASEAAKRIIFR